MRKYATLSIYANEEIALVRALGYVSIRPSARTERNGKFAAHYSSEHGVLGTAIRDHMQYLADSVKDQRALRESSEITISVWVFAELEEVNAGLDFSKEDLRWLFEMNADLLVDIWR